MAKEKLFKIRLDMWKGLTLLALVLVAVTLYVVLQIRNELSGGTSSVGTQQPSRVKVDIKDEPALGSKNAKVIMVEFIDFQCPFCKRFADQTLSSVKQEYIYTGKVLLVYRDFPLPFHTEADEWAEGINCGFDVGGIDTYMTLHDKAFATQDQWSGSSDIRSYIKTALKDELGTSYSEWEQCFDSKKYQSEISSDIQDGVKYGVGGTPTFYIGTPSKGYVEVVGAQPYSVFKQVLDQELSS